MVADDEPETATNLNSLLQFAGITVISLALSVADAQLRISDHRIDLAVMDINLGGDNVSSRWPKRVAAMRVPFAFVSGHPWFLMPTFIADFSLPSHSARVRP